MTPVETACALFWLVGMLTGFGAGAIFGGSK